MALIDEGAPRDLRRHGARDRNVRRLAANTMSASPISARGLCRQGRDQIGRLYTHDIRAAVALKPKRLGVRTGCSYIW